jgi:hypothetical protein
LCPICECKFGKYEKNCPFFGEQMLSGKGEGNMQVCITNHKWAKKKRREGFFLVFGYQSLLGQF